MGAPTKSKTWAYRHYTNPAGTIPSGGLQSGSSTWDGENRMVLYNLKALLVAAGWTVVSSSNGTSAGASDYWASGDDVLFKVTTTYSWIVLKQTGIASNFQVCISCEAAANATEAIYVYVSYSAGFSGGTTSARPTATDEYTLVSAAGWCDTQQATRNSGVSVFTSSDGACTRIYTSASVSGVPTLAYVWMFDKPNPTYTKSWWAKPHVAGITQTTWDYVLTGFSSGGANNGQWSTTIGSFAGVKVGLTAQTYQSGSPGGGRQYPLVSETTWFGGTNVNGDWECWPCGVACTASYCPGFLGRLFDFWVVSTALVTGDYFDETGSKAFVVLGDILQPSDGSTVVID